MKLIKSLILAVIILPMTAQAQNHPHFTMFMFNKLIYNPAYVGNKNMTTVNATYRNQWTGLEGAPTNFSVAIDGPVGSYMKPFRPHALGMSVTNEKIGVTNTTNIMGYYAFRIPVKNTVLSLGLQAGVSLFNAEFSKLNAKDPDMALQNDIKNSVLPNFGPGVYWTGKKFYVGASIPSLLQNYYDNENQINPNTKTSKQVRNFYLSGGYVFDLSENVKLQPQILTRYAGNGQYQLPWSADFNLSCILYDRIMLGATYRTDESFAGIVHLQATRFINVGYSYDFSNSGLNPYNNGSHEVTLGFDFIRDLNKYVNPRFIKTF